MNECGSPSLSPPVMQEPHLTVYVWVDTVFFFNLPVAQPVDCSEWTYKLFVDFSDTEVDSNLYTISPDAAVPQIEFYIPSREPWLSESPIDVRIEATFGSFGTVVSDPPLEITVKEPCYDTQVQPQFIRQLTTFLNNPNPPTRTFEVFYNSIDLEYRQKAGQQTDLCGAQEYAIFELQGSDKVPSDLVTVDPVSGTLTLATNDEAERYLHDMLLQVYLPEYDVTYYQPFAALVSDCTVTELMLTPSNPQKVVYYVQDPPEESSIALPDFSYQPEACIYDLVFTAKLLDGSDLPSFIQFNP